MNLFRVYAYAAEPQRTTENSADPVGGAIRVNTDIRTALEEASRLSRLGSRTLFDLKVNPRTGTSEIRDFILSFGFGNIRQASIAGLNLAKRLSGAMDLRSTPCLFIIAAERDRARRRITMWTFPRDEAFQFLRARGKPSIKLLTDIFSRTSKLRKAALFEGENRRRDFITGRALDFQANVTSREVADFWIGRFLDAVFSIRGEAGTRQLAKCIRIAYQGIQDPRGKEQLHAAIVAVRSSPQRRWSLSQFADTYLQGEVRDIFLGSAPNEETVNSSFDFDRDVFDHAVNFHVFRLDSDVWVSAPFDEVGRSVIVSGEEQRRLRCEGTVVEEYVKTRHA